MTKQCPKCGQLNVQVFQHEGRSATVCRTCNWTGPGCFGEKWEAHNPKCFGGNDSTYWNEEEKTHKRPQCGLYQSCAAEMNRQRIQGISPLTVPVQPPPTALPVIQPGTVTPPMIIPRPPPQPQQSVTIPMPDGTKKTLTLTPPPGPAQPRSVQVLPAPPPPMQMPAAAVPQVQATSGQPQPMMYQTTHNGQPMLVMMVPPHMAQAPSLVPQNTVQPGTQAMAVLTVMEPIELPYFKRFVGSVGRSMLKYGFLSAANMMDHVPWWG